MRCAICSSVNRMRSIPGGSLLMASRLIASRSYLCSYFGGPLRQAVLEDQVFEILLIEDLHGQVRIQLPQQPDLAVLARHQRLFHGGEFHVQIELRQIEIGRERFGNASLRIPLYRKIARLVLPGDAVEIQQVGEDLLALVGEVLAGQPHHAGRHDAVPGAGGSETGSAPRPPPTESRAPSGPARARNPESSPPSARSPWTRRSGSDRTSEAAPWPCPTCSCTGRAARHPTRATVGGPQ